MYISMHDESVKIFLKNPYPKKVSESYGSPKRFLQFSPSTPSGSVSIKSHHYQVYAPLNLFT